MVLETRNKGRDGQCDYGVRKEKKDCMSPHKSYGCSWTKLQGTSANGGGVDNVAGKRHFPSICCRDARKSFGNVVGNVSHTAKVNCECSIGRELI